MVRIGQLVATGLMLLASLGASAQETGPSLPPNIQKNPIKGAVEARITAKGTKVFGGELSRIMGNLGYQLNEGYFPEYNYQAEKPIDLDELAKTSPEEVRIFKNVREMMTKWLMGLTLAEHRPAVRLAETQYHAEFNRFALVTDQALMNTLGKRDGAVFAIEMEVKRFDATSASIRAWDMNNPQLGEFGVNDGQIVAGSSELPIKLRIPVYVRVDEQGLLRFEPLPFTHNFEQIPLELRYQKIVTPTVVITINGHSYQLNNEQLNSYVTEKMPDILKAVRDNIETLAKEVIPTFFNEKAERDMQSSFEEIQAIAAPGAEADDKRPPLLWGLQLNRFNLKDHILNISLNAFVEDPHKEPRQAVAAAPNPKDAARGPVNFNLDTSKYDIALSIDRGLVNRVLALSYHRKNFEKIALESGETLSLRAIPTIDTPRASLKLMPAGPKETFVKLAVTTEYEMKGFDLRKLFLQGKIVVSFDLIAKIRQVKDKSGMQVVFHMVDLESVHMDPKFLTGFGSLLKGTVMNQLKSEFQKYNDGFAKKEQGVPGTLEFPPKILGFPLDIVKLDMDPNGHLVMYTNFVTGGKP